MTSTTKKAISMLLVLVQLFVLFPVLQPQAEAAQTESETPILNKTIVGTVDFQAFNLLGDNETGTDGTDYHSTFYYSDDYFAPSAINGNTAIASQTQTWGKLENPSLAACSAAFAFASFTSNIDNVTSNTTNSGKHSWNNTNYTNKDQNIKRFLEQCEFDRVVSYGLTEKPTIDSIGYTIGSKQITVWNGTENKTYTLVAVGVRGAGYDSEWADNVTIGNPATGEMPGGRHWGFDNSAKTVCSSIRQYLDGNRITGDVKYWVTGFSRAAAVANLVAGYLTDNTDTYRTADRQTAGAPDVYAYTWECPQAASTIGENALAYRNIHNIINPMDAVPKVSPTAFQHQRLGVDYQMPYHGNTNSTQNDQLYRQMWNVIQTIIRTDDKLYNAVNPSNYPYNKALPIYTVSALQMIDDAIWGDLATNFGTYKAVTGYSNILSRGYVGNRASDMLGSGNWYLDQFIDELIKVFLTSTAWDRDYSGSTTNVITHRTRFINNYQEDFRNILGYLLDYSGPAFLGLIPQLINAVGAQITNINVTNLFQNTGFAFAFAGFYFFSLGKEQFISAAQDLAVSIVNEMTADYADGINGSGISREEMNQSLRHAVSVVVDLYAVEKDQYKSQYFGTTLHWLDTILCTHLQETVLSWIMSLDPNHMNRSCRTLTVPASADVTLYQFRSQYGETPTDLATTAQPVAVIHGGDFVDGTLKDERITLTHSGSSLVIRYPASLEIRADVTATGEMNLNTVQVNDYQTKNAYTNVSDNWEQQYEPAAASLTSTLFTPKNSTGVTGATATASNNKLSGYGTLAAGDTLHVLVNGMADFNSSTTKYTLSVDKAPDVTVLDFAAGGGMASGTDQASAVRLGINTTVSTGTDPSRNIQTRTTVITVPASSVYFDDELTGNSVSGYNAGTTRLDNADEGRTFWYQFRGTRIDVYCTTDSNTGYVMAAVTDENDDIIVNADGQRMITTMKSASDIPRYNVPTISFDGLEENTDYYLKIYALKNANYHLDGIRVYHSADENADAVKTAYKAVGEQNAKYVNLRALLLGAVSEDKLSADGNEGALFYTESGSFALGSDEYVANSPKNEIYLQPGDSVAFQIRGSYEKAAVGLSAPETQTDGGSVTMTNGSEIRTQPVASALDQYYPVIPAPDGSVVIENSGSAVISITNVKLSGEYTPTGDAQLSEAPLMVSRSLMRYAASFSELPVTEEPAPTPEPTPEAPPEPTSAPDFGDMIRQLISSFVSALFGSISRLFGA